MTPVFRRVALLARDHNQCLVAVLPRFASTSSADAKPERLSRNLSFRPAFDSHLAIKERPLVLVYGWLVAKAKHIHKYGDFYLGKGFDVLHIKIEPLQLVWPETAQQVVQQVVDFVDNPDRQQQPLLVHGFSVGGYLYGETLQKWQTDARLKENINGRLVGQVFDSPVDYEGIPRGISRAVTPVPIIQKTLQGTLNTYLNMFPKKVVHHYHVSSGRFHENPFSTPSLVLNSETDIIGTPEPINVVVDKWRAKGVPVEVKTWKDSPHVSHFHYHPVEYINHLSAFLARLGLINDQGNKDKITLHN